MHYSFDFDYTLADSSQGTIECASHALHELGLAPVPDVEICKTIGLSLEETFTRLAGTGVDPLLAAEFKKHFLERAEVAMLEHIRFFDSAPRVLSKLKGQGHFVSIVSTKVRARLVQALLRDGLLELVDLVVGGDDVLRNKPDPEGLIKAIEASGVATSDTIYVGDSVSDGECAARAGVGFIALTTGTTGRADLQRWSPISLCDSLDQLA